MEKTKPSPPVLGRGAYSLSEVARYASVRPSTVRQWFKGRRDHQGRGPVFASGWTNLVWEVFARKIVKAWPDVVANVVHSARPTVYEVKAGNLKVQRIGETFNL